MHKPIVTEFRLTASLSEVFFSAKPAPIKEGVINIDCLKVISVFQKKYLKLIIFNVFHLFCLKILNLYKLMNLYK